MSKLITIHLAVGASVEKVWETLTELRGDHLWNPFITAAAARSVSGGLDLTQTTRLATHRVDSMEAPVTGRARPAPGGAAPGSGVRHRPPFIAVAAG